MSSGDTSISSRVQRPLVVRSGTFDEWLLLFCGLPDPSPMALAGGRMPLHQPDFGPCCLCSLCSVPGWPSPLPTRLPQAYLLPG